jgi:DinB family protein
VGRIRWVDRRFDFDFPVELYPELLERIRGTPARVAERLAGVSPLLLTQRSGGKWSVQEHAGHLADLDDTIFLPRLDEYDQGLGTLRAADMTNRATEAAQHNSLSLDRVVGRFRATRAAILARLDPLGPEAFVRVARHPRLDVAMRLVDLVYLQAEHDDYHLTSISEILCSARPPA